MAGRVVNLVLRGDNRSAVRALKGIADQSDETTDAVKGGADEQTAGMTKVKESTLGLRDAFASMAGMVGIAGVALGLKDLVEGGMSLQNAQTNLRASLKETGNGRVWPSCHRAVDRSQMRRRETFEDGSLLGRRLRGARRSST